MTVVCSLKSKSRLTSGPSNTVHLLPSICLPRSPNSLGIIDGGVQAFYSKGAERVYGSRPGDAFSNGFANRSGDHSLRIKVRRYVHVFWLTVEVETMQVTTRDAFPT